MKKTWYDKVSEILIPEGIPMQRKDLFERLSDSGETVTYKGFGVVLNNLIKAKKLYVYKVKGFPGFYCIPSWLSAQTNSLKPQYDFDPYTKTKLNEPEDNTVGIPHLGNGLGRN
jgi:hypothetical protein